MSRAKKREKDRTKLHKDDIMWASTPPSRLAACGQIVLPNYYRLFFDQSAKLRISFLEAAFFTYSTGCLSSDTTSSKIHPEYFFPSNSCKKHLEYCIQMYLSINIYIFSYVYTYMYLYISSIIELLDSSFA